LNPLSRVDERYRQTDDRQSTDGRAIAYSEREREFTFAKKPTCSEETDQTNGILASVLS